MTAVIGTGTVDTDVHCAPSSLAELEPFLDAYWREYLVDGGQSLSPSQGGAYPALAPTSGGAPATDVEQLRSALLEPESPRLAVLNCTTSFHCNRNPYYEAALTRAINDWLAERWLSRDSRLRASLLVPTLDPDAAVAEINRLGHHPQFVQVLLPVRTDAPWGNLRHRPLLRAAAEHDLVVGLHAWGRIGHAPSPSGLAHTYLEDYLANSQILVQAQVTSLITQGVFAELPSLRVSLLECGFSWLPALLWRFDKDWKGVWREVPWLTGKPSEVARRHLRLTTAPAQLPQDPAHVRQALDLIDAGTMLMYASDHPHNHGPGGSRLLAALTAEERTKILSTNADAWYSFGA